MLITVVNIAYISNSMLDHSLFGTTVAFQQNVSSSAPLKKAPWTFASVYESLIVRHIGQINKNCWACCCFLMQFADVCSVRFTCSICVMIIILTILLLL